MLPRLSAHAGQPQTVCQRPLLACAARNLGFSSLLDGFLTSACTRASPCPRSLLATAESAHATFPDLVVERVSRIAVRAPFSCLGSFLPILARVPALSPAVVGCAFPETCSRSLPYKRNTAFSNGLSCPRTYGQEKSAHNMGRLYPCAIHQLLWGTLRRVDVAGRLAGLHDRGARVRRVLVVPDVDLVLGLSLPMRTPDQLLHRLP